MNPDDRHRPVDLQELREAEALTRSWDAWLEGEPDDPLQDADGLDPALVNFALSLQDRDRTPRPNSGFRRSLKRDLLHAYDALHSGVAPEISPTRATLESTTAPFSIQPGRSLRRSKKSRRWNFLPSTGRWWPAIEFAAAMILIAGLLGVTFGNARIAKLFRDNAEPTMIAAVAGQPTELPTSTPPPTPSPTPAPTEIPPTPVITVTREPDTRSVPDAGTTAQNAEAGNSAVIGGSMGGGAATAANAGLSGVASGGSSTELYPVTVSSSIWTQSFLKILGGSFRPEYVAASEINLYIVGTQDDGTYVMLALDAATGLLSWMSDPLPDALAGAPVAAEGMVFVVTRSGQLMAWAERGGPLVTDLDIGGSVGSPPVILNGLAYVATGDEASPPSLIWNGGYLLLSGSSTDRLVTVNYISNETLASQWVQPESFEQIENAVWQIDPDTGESIDFWPSQDFEHRIAGVVALDETTVVLPTQSSDYAWNGFVVLDTVSMTALDQLDLSGQMWGLPVVAGTTIYYPIMTPDGMLTVASYPTSGAGTSFAFASQEDPSRLVVLSTGPDSVLVATGPSFTITFGNGTAIPIGVSFDPYESVVQVAATKSTAFALTDTGVITAYDILKMRTVAGTDSDPLPAIDSSDQ